MADSKLQVFNADGSTAAIDIRTESTTGDGRQVIVVGDPTSNNAVASVQATDPSSNVEGLVVRDVNTSAMVAALGGTLAIYVHTTAGTLAVDVGKIQALKQSSGDGASATNMLNILPMAFNGSTHDRLRNNTGVAAGALRVVMASDAVGSISVASVATSIGVYFDRGNPTVTANAGSGSFTVQFDPGHELGSLKGINNSISAHILSTAGTLGVRVGQIDGSVAVYFSPGNPSVNATFTSTSLEIVPTTGSRVLYDLGHQAVRALIVGSQAAASLQVIGITNSIAVHVGSTGGTLGVRVGQVDGTVAVYFSQSRPAVLADSQHTSSIFTVSGSTSGGTTSGVTLVAPSASYNFKVFAYSLQTTGIVSEAWRFTNGAGSETELWRPLITAAASASAPLGANLAVPPPAYIFATGTNTTLALKSSSGSLVHYSVSYIKESA